MGCCCSTPRIGEYEILERIEMDSYSKAFKAHKPNAGFYAIKVISKPGCVKAKAVEELINERRLLSPIARDHYYLVNLKDSIQDDHYCYLVFDLVAGGDLRSHLNDGSRTFTEEMTCFYITEIALALEYLRGEGIIHRDVTPDNIALNDGGHVHLKGFGKAIEHTSHEPIHGVFGNPDYRAPEMVKSDGYTYTVDWWALGVCAYELIYRCLPSRGQGGRLQLPPGMCSPAALNALTRLLDVNPKARLGSEPDVEAWRECEWFRQTDWDNITIKSTTPPKKLPPSKIDKLTTDERARKWMTVKDSTMDAQQARDLSRLTAEFPRG